MRSIWDKIGISTSVICVIHCLFTPVLVAALPFLGETFSHELFHTVTVLIVLPVATWALWNGYQLHKMKRVLYLGGVGITLLVAAMTLGRHDEKFEYALMIAAGLVLASAHLVNLRACRLEHR